MLISSFVLSVLLSSSLLMNVPVHLIDESTHGMVRVKWVMMIVGNLIV